jgi:hypothetical protein
MSEEVKSTDSIEQLIADTYSHLSDEVKALIEAECPAGVIQGALGRLFVEMGQVSGVRKADMEKYVSKMYYSTTHIRDKFNARRSGV